LENTVLWASSNLLTISGSKVKTFIEKTLLYFITLADYWILSLKEFLPKVPNFGLKDLELKFRFRWGKTAYHFLAILSDSSSTNGVTVPKLTAEEIKES
jgi:hypothetical protein